MSTSPSFGTLAWARRTGGNLRLRDHVAQVRDALHARLRARRPPAAVLGEAELHELARRPLPGGAFAEVAERACRTASPPWLVEHGIRTFVWGDLLGARDGVAVDRDALFLAALLHDLGLTDAHPTPRGRCFALVGAEAAVELLRGAGAGEDLALRVGDAITLHLNAYVGPSHDPVARLLQAGAAFDVIGARVRDLPRACVDEVLRAHPRHGCARGLAAAMRAQAARCPATRVGWLVRRFGFIALIERAWSQEGTPPPS
jgi:hypothetical protein